MEALYICHKSPRLSMWECIVWLAGMRALATVLVPAPASHSNAVPYFPTSEAVLEPPDPRIEPLVRPVLTGMAVENCWRLQELDTRLRSRAPLRSQVDRRLYIAFKFHTSMRHITSISLSVLVISLSAQPVLNSNEMLPFGSVMNLWPAGNPGIVIDTALQGANAVWDFSALSHWTGNNPDMQITVVDPSTTPYASLFPSANYAWMEQPNTAYRYFNLSSSSLQRVGSFTFGPNVYSNPQVEMVYPLQLGTSNTDTWNNTFSATGGTYSLRCVGTGTLILPSATWEDVLMVRVWVTEGDNDPFLGYFWYSSVNGAVLVQSIGQYSLEYHDWFGDTYHLNSISTGVEEHAALELLSSQNPVTDELRLETRSQHGGQQPWRVVGLTGQVMSSGTFSSTSGGVDRWSIPVNDLATGMYVLWMGDANEAVSLRFVKQ